MSWCIFSLNFLLLFATGPVTSPQNTENVTTIEEIKDLENTFIVLKIAKKQWQNAQKQHVEICKEYLGMRQISEQSKDPQLAKKLSRFANTKMERSFRKMNKKRKEYENLVISLSQKDKIERSYLFKQDAIFSRQAWK